VTAAVLAGARPRPWLAPLGVLFGGAAALRAGLYRRGILARERLGAPVISIGNLAVGGRGKTPLVELTATVLRDAGRAVAVLSRGYGGSFRGEALVVSNGERVLAGAEEAGDEPVMLARALPGVMVAVGRDRVRLGRVVEERLGARVHVLDDGFQHLRLHRDLDLVCVDALDLRERPLPAGVLREGLSALERADLVAVGGEDEEAAGAALEALASRLGRVRVFRVRRRPTGFVDLSGDPAVPPQRAFLVSGIARPERFASDIAALGVAVAGHAAFPDHHRFRPDEVEAALARARAAGADAVVTTAKDAVRLPAPASTPPVLVFRVHCAVEDEMSFRDRVLAAAGPR
jgi:tetraacyldisaccharide 4'-kinase